MSVLSLHSAENISRNNQVIGDPDTIEGGCRCYILPSQLMMRDGGSELERSYIDIPKEKDIVSVIARVQ